MADDSNNDSALPPKLDLRRKIGTPPDQQAAEPSPAVPRPPAVSAPVPADLESSPSTVRITLPETRESGERETPKAAAPKMPKPTGTPVPTGPKPLQAATGSAPSADPRPTIRPVMAPKTIKLKKPVPLGIKRDTPDPTAAPGSKRATSKISLPASSDDMPATAPTGPKPITITKTAPADTETAEAGSDTATKPTIIPQPAPDPKRQTSRISLDSALGNESASGPKTIKLKRPNTSGAIKVQGSEPSSGSGSLTSGEITSPAGTAEPDETTNTQKKTIKVKRPSVRTSQRPSLAGGSTTASNSSPTMFTPPAKALAPVDHAHWFFIVTGCAATIITGVLVYVLTAQAFGPNISLTELSYGAPDMELPWPGRIAR